MATMARPAHSIQARPSHPVDNTINILVTTFAGLGLPRTLSLPTKAQTPIRDVYNAIFDRLPNDSGSLIVSTVSNKQLLPSNASPISTLLSSADDNLLSLRLSQKLCGGKGGFGSQLRAAGGRMSSRKNRDKQNQNVNGSNRNLDGRRLRTVDEAKRLAEYLAVKPDMDKREREERKKRWQDIIDSTERKEEEIRSGKVGSNQGRLNAEYVESKDLAEEKTREAVLKAMREGTLQLERTGSESSMDQTEDSDEGHREGSSDSSKSTGPSAGGQGSTSFFGWDEDDEDDEDEEEEDDDVPSETVNAEEDEHTQSAAPTYEGKGKARVT